MPRPKTKSDKIQFRLPLDVEAWIAEKAAEKGVSVATACERMVVKAVEQARSGRPEPLGPCSHANTKPGASASGTAILLCRDCPKRRINGKWID